MINQPHFRHAKKCKKRHRRRLHNKPHIGLPTEPPAHPAQGNSSIRQRRAKLQRQGQISGSCKVLKQEKRTDNSAELAIFA